jgi:hypothetical protein
MSQEKKKEKIYVCTVCGKKKKSKRVENCCSKKMVSKDKGTWNA